MFFETTLSNPRIDLCQYQPCHLVGFLLLPLLPHVERRLNLNTNRVSGQCLPFMQSIHILVSVMEIEQLSEQKKALFNSWQTSGYQFVVFFL